MARDEEDDYKQRAAQRRKEKLERGRFKLVEGENIIRILKTPSDKKRKSPGVFIEYLMHNEVGPEKRFIRCGHRISGRGDCWICDTLIPKLEAKGRTSAVALLRPKPMLEVQIAVVESDTGKMRGPLRYYLSSGDTNKSLSYKIQGIIASSKRDYLDHKRGYNIVIERSGTGRNDTSYELIGPEEESSKVPSSIVDKLKPFADVIPPYDEEAQKAAYYGKDEEEDVKDKKKKRYDEDEDESSKKKKKKARDDEDEEEDDEEEDDEEEDDDDEPKKKKKKKSRDDDDDDEDEEEEESESDDDDDDEDEEPKKKKKKKKSKSDDDDEEEEESDDDEEDEDEPKKKKKKRSKDDDDEDEEEDDEEEDDEEEDDEEEDDEEEDDEEEDEPKKKKKKRK